MTSIEMPTGATSTLDDEASDTSDHAKAGIQDMAVLPPDQQDDVASGTRHHIPHPGAPLVGRVNPFAGASDAPGIGGLFGPPLVWPPRKPKGGAGG